MKSSGKKGFFHRFAIPVFAVMIPLIVAFIIYFNSWRIENHTVHQFAAIASGLLMILGAMLGALLVYPLAYFREAKLSERIIAALVPGIAFVLYQIYIASGVFSFSESLYYGLNPVSITIFFLAFGFMGFCELVGRWMRKRRGENIKVLTFVPIAAIAVMLTEFYAATIWRNGAHFFYAYVDIYMALQLLGLIRN